MRHKYLNLFKSISIKIENTLSDVFGTELAKKELDRGVFGDTTVYIDKIAEDIVINEIKASKLKCSILTEESGWIRCGADLPIVIVDPIDGSLNAKRGMPYFSFSIALSEGNTTDDITVGFVKNLSNSDEFYAVKSEGAFLNDKSIYTLSKDVNVAAVEGFKKTTDPKIITAIYSAFNKVRQMGSMALDICYLSVGGCDVFLNVIESRVIDYAASKIILEEAGGCFCRWVDKNRFVANITKDKGGRFLCVSNKILADKLIGLLRGIV